MNALFTLILAALLTAPMCLAERAVPFENLYLRILTSPKDGRTSHTAKFWVQLHVSIDAKTGKPLCQMSADYRDIDKFFLMGLQPNSEVTSRGRISEGDIRALKGVLESAVKGEALSRQVTNKGKFINPKADEIKTTYSSVKTGGLWRVRVQREQSTIDFSTEEALQLLEAHRDAHHAVRWYETLLTAKELPKPDKTLRPPEGSLLDFQVDLGGIERADLSYSANINRLGEYALIHWMTISDGAYRDSVRGDWVRDMMLRTAEATDAAQKQDGYSFIGRHGDFRYEVTADPHERTAELRIHPYFGGSNLFMKKADFGKEDGAEIRAMIQQSDRVGEWLAKHGELLLPRKPEGQDGPSR